MKLSQLAAELPAVAELDINPLLADADGVVALDARVVLRRPGSARPLPGIRPYPRRLAHTATTKRGIGPAYEDKVGRRAIRLVDLSEPDTLMVKIERLLTHHNALRRGMGLVEIDAQKIYDELTAVAADILPFMDQVWQVLDDKRKSGARIQIGRAHV